VKKHCNGEQSNSEMNYATRHTMRRKKEKDGDGF
jgi:hypothetical protein